MPGPRSYTPRLLGEEYARFADLAMQHTTWAIRHDTDEDGVDLFVAHHPEGGYIATPELSYLAAALTAVEQAMATRVPAPEVTR